MKQLDKRTKKSDKHHVSKVTFKDPLVENIALSSKDNKKRKKKRKTPQGPWY
jgi:hypothetical protein